MRMKISMVIFGSLMFACSEKNADKIIDEKSDSKSFLVENSIEPFLDVSSELRCTALKEFYVDFSSKVLGGTKVSNFSCQDQSSLDEGYFVKFELQNSDRSAVVIQKVSGSIASYPEFCPIHYESFSDVDCLSQPFYFSEGARVSGNLHDSLPNIKEYLQSYIAQEHTKDLVYGIDGNLFAEQWTGKFDGTLRFSLMSAEDPLDLWLKLIPSVTSPKFGTAEIVDAEVKAFELGKSFFFCTTKDCLTEREYQYRFNGHRLVITTKTGETLTLFLEKAE